KPSAITAATRPRPPSPSASPARACTRSSPSSASELVDLRIQRLAAPRDARAPASAVDCSAPSDTRLQQLQRLQYTNDASANSATRTQDDQRGSPVVSLIRTRSPSSSRSALRTLALIGTA